MKAMQFVQPMAGIEFHVHNSTVPAMQALCFRVCISARPHASMMHPIQFVIA